MRLLIAGARPRISSPLASDLQAEGIEVSYIDDYTGLQMQLDSEEDDKEMLASLDRIDSAGHYELENVHLVCRFINRWKGADEHEKFRRLLARLHPTSSH